MDRQITYNILNYTHAMRAVSVTRGMAQIIRPLIWRTSLVLGEDISRNHVMQHKGVNKQYATAWKPCLATTLKTG